MINAKNRDSLEEKILSCQKVIEAKDLLIKSQQSTLHNIARSEATIRNLEEAIKKYKDESFKPFDEDLMRLESAVESLPQKCKDKLIKIQRERDLAEMEAKRWRYTAKHTIIWTLTIALIAAPAILTSLFSSSPFYVSIPIVLWAFMVFGFILHWE